MRHRPQGPRSSEPYASDDRDLGRLRKLLEMPQLLELVSLLVLGPRRCDLLYHLNQPLTVLVLVLRHGV